MDRHVHFSNSNGNQVKIKSIDTLSRQNAKDHHTHKFDRVYDDEGLTIRRGQAFEIILHFNKKFDPNVNTLRFVFTTSDDPRPGAGTHVDFWLSKELKFKEWSAVVAEKRSKTDYFITLTSPPNCIVSNWQLVVEVITNTAKGQEVTSVYIHPTLVYILFNPWCRGDDVYFPDVHLLKEYVLNDSGVIFHGNKNQIGAKPWFFGQFEDGILETCLWCVRKGFNDNITKAMADPVRVSRIISKIVNSFDDNGILTGRWDSDYIDGVSPLKWSGSVRILRQYARTGKAVKYGQCFVFSGIVTTICRALGLPSRCVTNFSSAHDSDGSITVDIYWDLQRHEAVDGVGVRDSVWNFHCWNDVWMNRNDLTPGYNGWQVIDSTPQERSDGMYQCGPMSVAAIKAGKCELLYDGPFVFAEVNADKVNWGRDGGHWFILSLDKSSVGRNISTKVPDGMPVKPYLTDVASIRQDITDDYKYKDESDRERLAVINANRSALKTRPVYNRGYQDIIFGGFDQRDFIMIGKEFKVTVTFRNVGDHVRTIKGRLVCESVSYIGIKQKTIKEHSFEIPLDPRSEDVASMKVGLTEYLPHISEQMGMKVSAILQVVETGHIQAFQDDFRLRKPDIQIEILDNHIRVGESFKCRLSFTNPLSAALSKCCLTIEGPGLDNEEQFDLSNISGHQEWAAHLQLTPRKPGRRQITASLDTHQIQNIVGVAEVKVLP